MQEKQLAPASLHSPKGRSRSYRIGARINYLDVEAVGWAARAEASALRWALDRLEHLESTPAKRTVSQAQAVCIIRAWNEAGCQTTIDGDPILDGLDLERLAIR